MRNFTAVVRWSLVGTVLTGCGGKAAEQVDSAQMASSAASAQVVATDSALATTDGCRKEGLWQWCSVEDRMEHAGVILTRQDAAPSGDLLRGEGRGYKVGAGDDELHIFVYPTVEARQADTGALDSVTVSPKGAPRRSYKVVPLLVTSNNLAALVFTLNERTSERLANALSAGLPQPGR